MTRSLPTLLGMSQTEFIFLKVFIKQFYGSAEISVLVELWYFCTDPDPWIRTLSCGSGSSFFPSVADQMPTKNKFFCLLPYEGTFTSGFNNFMYKK
jgi:hypothetical protein